MYRKLTPRELEYISNSSAFDSFEDVAQEMTINAWHKLERMGYSENELIDVSGGKDSIEVSIVGDKIIVYCINEVIYEAPTTLMLHKFMQEGEKALCNWYIYKIDGDDNYYTNESQMITISKFQLKKLITESVKEALSAIRKEI